MTLSLYVFIGLLLAFCGAAAYFLRATFSVLAGAAADHAKLYALAYAKGTALVLIAMITAFDENFRALTKDQALAFQWWNWAILFLKPILAGQAVFAAFIDKSVQRAQESRTATTPPFANSPHTPLS